MISAPHNSRQMGVALAVVMWFIAGMSLLVAGIVGHARVDLQLAQLHVARAKTAAAGDGAIRMALADHTIGRAADRVDQQEWSLLPIRAYKLGDVPVEVRMHPANGLVNLNVAGPQVSEGLFVLAGGLDPGEAAVVADNVVKWRQTGRGPRNSRGAGFRDLQSIEDLLKIDGATRSLVDGIRDYAVAAEWSSGDVDWSMVPEEMLQLLEQVDPGRVDAVLRRRDNWRQQQVEGTGLDRRLVAGTRIIRVDALVQYGDDTWLRRRWVDLGGSGDSALPWSVLRIEPPRIVVNDERR